MDLHWTAQPVVFNGRTSVGRLSFTIMVTYEDGAVAVTADHLFLIGGRLERADRLTPDDTLTSPEGNPVPIRGLHVGEYFGSLNHIAVSLEKPDDELNGRMLNTNGVVSADYVVQVMARGGEALASGPFAEERPVIGSPEYVARYGVASLQAPDFVAGFQNPPIPVARHDARDLPMGVFIPASLTSTDIPHNACS